MTEAGQTAVPSQSAGPVATHERSHALDVIRGVAVLGILLLNIVNFGLPFAYFDPTNHGGATGLDLLAWQINALFFEGAMRGLFSLLFGAGIVLMAERALRRDAGIVAADIHYRRSLWLILFGLIDAWLLLWPGDILYAYGICGLILFVFRNVAPLRLIALSALIVVTMVGLEVRVYLADVEDFAKVTELRDQVDTGATLAEEDQELLDGWGEYEAFMKPSAEMVEERIEAKTGSYFDIIALEADGIVRRETTDLLRYTLWDSLSMMFLGMALLRLGVLTGERSVRFYLSLAASGYALGLSVNSYEVLSLLRSNFDIMVMAKMWLTYDLGRIPMTLGHVGLVMLLVKCVSLPLLGNRLAAVGRMALSNYLAHSVICAIVFTGVGFGLYGQLSRFELLYVLGAIWLAQLIISPIWLRHFRFGPAEWLWRSLTYARRQPLRRRQETTDT